MGHRYIQIVSNECDDFRRVFFYSHHERRGTVALPGQAKMKKTGDGGSSAFVLEAAVWILRAGDIKPCVVAMIAGTPDDTVQLPRRSIGKECGPAIGTDEAGDNRDTQDP